MALGCKSRECSRRWFKRRWRLRFPFLVWEDDCIAWSMCSTAGFYRHERMSQLGGLRWELAHVGARGTGCSTPAAGDAITITAIAQTLPATTFYVTGDVVTRRSAITKRCGDYLVQRLDDVGCCVDSLNIGSTNLHVIARCSKLQKSMGVCYRVKNISFLHRCYISMENFELTIKDLKMFRMRFINDASINNAMISNLLSMLLSREHVSYLYLYLMYLNIRNAYQSIFTLLKCAGSENLRNQ